MQPGPFVDPNARGDVLVSLAALSMGLAGLLVGAALAFT